MWIRTAIGCLPFLAATAAEPHWAYQPPVAVLPPGAEGKHPVDALLEAARVKAGVKSAGETHPRQWLERASYTLTGLLPSEAQLKRIEGTPDDATRRALIDELLASPAYGERWARHWMDVARYADTSGYNFDQDNRYPFAYTYRDWLIRSFNSDLPFAKFIELQMAADLIVDRPDHPDLAALGFLTVGPRAGDIETIDDRVDVVTRGFLATTVSCARCHNHKTDPITTEDYYSIYSIFDNAQEPGDKPVVGTPPDKGALEAYQAELKKLEDEDRGIRQGIIDQLRNKDAIAVYLSLAWQAEKENWDAGKTAAESFKRGRYRARAVTVWMELLKVTTSGDKATPRLAAWAKEMETADEAGRKAACEKLAEEWTTALSQPEHELAALTKDGRCPLSYNLDRAQQVMDADDDNARRARASKMSKLQAEHPGSPPRAMAIKDKAKWSEAVVFKRGNPGSRGEPFARHWLSVLGGGTFPTDKSARLSLAEKIADPKNPLTARVIVNRVWAWNFGAPLADPGDFGPQQPDPALRPLLDWLAVWFIDHGGSVKELNRLLLTSQAFRLSADGPVENNARDEANTYFWKWNRRRLDFESMRDRLLETAGTLNTGNIGGRSQKLENADADSRRSLYAFIDRYALPGLFVSFDLPHPDHHSAGRSQTSVPQQALYFLNSPLLLRRSAALAADSALRDLPDDSSRVKWLYQRLFQRAPSEREIKAATGWIAKANPADYQPKLGGSWEVRHAADPGVLPLDVREFPIFANNVWKTGPDPATAPVRWLNVGASGGHVSARHAMILRWRANGAGEVKMSGHLKRTQKGGDILAWRIDGNGKDVLKDGRLMPDSETDVASEWITVQPGDTVDLVLRAPDGDACGNIAWTVKMSGRENAQAKPEEIGSFTRQFPTSSAPPTPPAAADPWADLIQMLWASNEFHFID